MRWTVETLNRAVDAEIEALPKDMRARLVRLTELIQLFGFRGLPRDSVKHLDEKLWELRITGRDGISRAIYVTASGQRVIILRVFIKKTQKTPQRELDVNFQEVVHSVPTRNAEVAKHQRFAGEPNGHAQECLSHPERSRAHGPGRCGSRT